MVCSQRYSDGKHASNLEVTGKITLKLKKLQGLPFAWAPSKTLERPEPCVHILFLKEGVPKLHKRVKPGPSPARRPMIWNHYYGRWRTLTSAHSNQIGKTQRQTAGWLHPWWLGDLTCTYSFISDLKNTTHTYCTFNFIFQSILSTSL